MTLDKRGHIYVLKRLVINDNHNNDEFRNKRLLLPFTK